MTVGLVEEKTSAGEPSGWRNGVVTRAAGGSSRTSGQRSMWQWFGVKVADGE